MNSVLQVYWQDISKTLNHIEPTGYFSSNLSRYAFIISSSTKQFTFNNTLIDWSPPFSCHWKQLLHFRCSCHCSIQKMKLVVHSLNVIHLLLVLHIVSMQSAHSRLVGIVCKNPRCRKPFESLHAYNQHRRHPANRGTLCANITCMGEIVVDTRRNIGTAIMRREDPLPLQGTFAYFLVFWHIYMYFRVLSMNSAKYSSICKNKDLPNKGPPPQRNYGGWPLFGKFLEYWSKIRKNITESFLYYRVFILEYFFWFAVFWSILKYLEYFWVFLNIVSYDHFWCFADNESEELHETESGVAESLIPRGEISLLVSAAVDISVASNAVQEAPLDVRQLMELAGKIDSIAQISRQLDHKMPGTEPVHSIRGAPQGRRADLKRKAADITRSSAETFAFLTTKNFSRDDAADLFTTFCNVSMIRSLWSLNFVMFLIILEYIWLFFSIMDYLSIFLSIMKYFWMFW